MAKKDAEGNSLLDTIERDALKEEARVGKIFLVITIIFVVIFFIARLFISY